MREGCSKPTVSWEDQNTQRVFTHCANRSSQTLLVQLPSADKQASSWRGRTSLIRFLPFTQFCVFNIPSKPDWENVPLCFLPMQHNLRASVCMSSQKRSCLPLLGHLRNTPLRSLVGHSHNVRWGLRNDPHSGRNEGNLINSQVCREAAVLLPWL